MTPNINSAQVPLVAKQDYTAYVEYLEARGWVREQLVIDELNANVSVTNALAAGATGVVIDITVPAGQKICMMGTQQVPRGADARTAHSLRMRIAGTPDVEIPIFTKMRMTKEKSSEAVVQLARVFYADVNMTKSVQSGGTTQKTDLEWYRFKSGVELNGSQHFRVYAINTEIGNFAIPAASVRFALDCDMFTRED